MTKHIIIQVNSVAKMKYKYNVDNIKLIFF